MIISDEPDKGKLDEAMLMAQQLKTRGIDKEGKYIDKLLDCRSQLGLQRMIDEMRALAMMYQRHEGRVR